MENFLTKFSGTIQNRQVKQLLKKLNKRRSAGEFQNSLEFQKEFEVLLEGLIQENLESSLIVYPALPLKRTDSEKFNDMLSNTYDSLEAAFEELDQIGKVQTNHQNIIKNVKLKNIESGVSELKTKLNLYKFINTNQYGFEDSIYSSFNETKEERVNRGVSVGNYLFLDQKTQKVLNSSFDAEVDPIGESLQLSSDNKKEIPIKYISQEFGGDFKKSILKSNRDPKEKLENIIDSVNGTYWFQIIRREEPDEIVKVKLVLTLAGIREINYLEIDSLFRNRLDKIDYIDSSGNLISILDANEYVDLGSEDKIVFSKIATEKLYLEFSIKENSLSQIIEGDRYAIDLIANILNNGQGKSFLEAAEIVYDSYRVYTYKMGIDNIRVGFHEHKNLSVYTSKPLFVKEETGILGLTSKERRPYFDNEILKLSKTQTGSEEYISSIEYWVIKEDLDSDEDNEQTRVLRTNVFPVFPIGTSTIYHERLVFTDISSDSVSHTKNIATINHFPDLSGSNEISLYRDGTLQASTEFSFESSSNTSVRNDKKMSYTIKVEDVNPGDIYTVSYTPLKGNTYSNEWNSESSDNLTQVDLVGDLTVRVGPEGVILLDESKDKRIKAYRVYLMIIIRQNTSNKNATAFLDEYRLSVGKRDLLKFEGTT